MSYDFKPSSVAMIAEYSQLLSSVFNKPQLFTIPYLEWQYAQNPAGEVVGYDAFYENKLVAHYVCIPFEAMINGKTSKALLSLNTATDSQHQGKGLFTQLASKTYEMAQTQGFSYVIGVANQNSVHGFLKKLAFKKLGQLDAFIGVGTIRMKSPDDFRYASSWSKTILDWRLKNPVANYTFRADTLYSPTAYPLIKAQLHQSATVATTNTQSQYRGIQLFIGNKYGIAHKRGLFTDIPTSLRPSPLHLIFRPLQIDVAIPSYEEVFFEALDFDAY